MDTLPYTELDNLIIEIKPDDELEENNNIKTIFYINTLFITVISITVALLVENSTNINGIILFVINSISYGIQYGIYKLSIQLPIINSIRKIILVLITINLILLYIYHPFII